MHDKLVDIWIIGELRKIQPIQFMAAKSHGHNQQQLLLQKAMFETLRALNSS